MGQTKRHQMVAEQVDAALPNGWQTVVRQLP